MSKQQRFTTELESIPSRGFGMAESLESRLCMSAVPPVIAATGLVATAINSTSIRLDWQDNAVNETGYTIYRSTSLNGTFRRVVALTEQNQRSYVDSNLFAGTQYFYKIFAQALTSRSAFSNTSNATTLTTITDAFAQLNADTGQLSIQGSNDNDVLNVSVSGANVVATLNGFTKTFAQTSVLRIAIRTLAGNDAINVAANVGDVYVAAGDGNDTINTSEGADRIDGGAGNDRIVAGDGNDTLTGGIGNDTIYGQAGNDSIQGGLGDDRLLGGDGHDRITGDEGNDRLYGEAGIDELAGGAGSNFVRQD